MLGKRPNITQSEYLGLGIQIAASMVMPLLLGVWLDRKFELTPWLTIVGAIFGIVSIFAIIFKIAYMANENSKNEREHRRNKEHDN